MPIDPDIRRASTLPAEVYHLERYFELQRDRVFAKSWQCVCTRAELAGARRAVPAVLYPGALDEPILLTSDEAGALAAMSNVCTHRGNVLVGEPCTINAIRCGYHGRRFDLRGRFLSMPEFEEAEAFPSPADDLPPVAVAEWGPFVFASLEPAVPFEEVIAPVAARAGYLDVSRLQLDPSSSRDYWVDANWALYCDNYLEGFHIPFVHPELAKRLDYSAYRTELFAQANLQIGVAANEADAFSLPVGHLDAGVAVAGWYFWLFPTTMINVYPWGISLNVIEPHGPSRTRVRFLSFVFDLAAPRTGAGAGLDRVELEDEAVVESVQRGVRSRLYHRGRYSPAREACVHHFHRLLAARMEL